VQSTADPGPRFCPRCGTALAAGLRFCPGCGFNTAEIAPKPASPTAEPSSPPSAPIWPDIDPDPSVEAPRVRATTPPAHAASGLSALWPERRPPARTIVVAALVVLVALVVINQLTRPGPGAPANPLPVASGLTQPGAPSAGPALIVGLTIQSPVDGQQIATKDVTVIGVAPPGLTITRDVSLGLDQHATTDGTGHWAMSVGLNEGENKLKFRIGDDRSTEQTLRVIFTPQGQ
jgi:hypothetical protein